MDKKNKLELKGVIFDDVFFKLGSEDEVFAKFVFDSLYRYTNLDFGDYQKRYIPSQRVLETSDVAFTGHVFGRYDFNGIYYILISTGFYNGLIDGDTRVLFPRKNLLDNDNE